MIQHVWGQFWVSNHAHVLKPKVEEQMYFLLQSLSTSDVRSFVTGAVQPKLSMMNLKRIPAMLPSFEIASCFSQLTAPLYQKKMRITEQIKTLAALRDMLLPKLMSGQLRVPEAEALVEQAGGRS